MFAQQKLDDLVMPVLMLIMFVGFFIVMPIGLFILTLAGKFDFTRWFIRLMGNTCTRCGSDRVGKFCAHCGLKQPR